MAVSSIHSASYNSSSTTDSDAASFPPQQEQNQDNNNYQRNQTQQQHDILTSSSFSSDGMPSPIMSLSLTDMVIGSVDTLCGTHFDWKLPETWNDRPPLLNLKFQRGLQHAQQQQETPTLLKGMIRKGIPPALRCAVWLSNIIQTVHPHQDAAYWHEYRTLAKVRALDHAYQSVLDQIVPPNETQENWHSLPTPTFGQKAYPLTDQVSDILVVEPPLPADTTPAGRLALKKVLLALERVVGFYHAPLVPTLAAALLTCMSESYVFCAIREMSHEASGFYSYFPQSDNDTYEHAAWCRAFLDVFTKLHKSTATYLDDRGVLDVPNLAPIFQDLFMGLLPLQYFLRIIDIYTLEGGKVLFRFGVALLVLFKIYAAENLLTISNAPEWWSALKDWAHSDKFHFEVVVRKAYGLHGKGLRRQLRFPRRAILDRIIKMEEERLLLEQQEKRDSEDNFSGRAGAGGGGQPLGLILPETQTAVSLAQEKEIAVPVLAQSTPFRLQLAQWLPLALHMTNLELLYSTNTHGRSLEMLYQRVSGVKHTILLCEAYPRREPGVDNNNENNDKNNNDVVIIGMYASQAWRASPKVYGDGGCFLFRLEPDPQCWKWSPTRRNKGTPKKGGSSSPNRSFLDAVDLEEDAESDDENAPTTGAESLFSTTRQNNETALLEQFMVGTKTYISMGGNADGSAGLRLNEDLTRGESSAAAGYDNEPLHCPFGTATATAAAPQHHVIANSVFEVGLVEVYGLMRQMDGRAA